MKGTLKQADLTEGLECFCLSCCVLRRKAETALLQLIHPPHLPPRMGKITSLWAWESSPKMGS